MIAKKENMITFTRKKYLRILMYALKSEIPMVDGNIKLINLSLGWYIKNSQHKEYSNQSYMPICPRI